MDTMGLLCADISDLISREESRKRDFRFSAFRSILLKQWYRFLSNTFTF